MSFDGVLVQYQTSTKVDLLLMLLFLCLQSVDDVFLYLCSIEFLLTICKFYVDGK